MGLLPRFFAAVFLLFQGAPAYACSSTSDCRLEAGTYRFEAPQNIAQPLPVVVYFHGYGSSAADTLKVDRNLVDRAIERGFVFLALNGVTRDFEGARNGWSVRDGQPAIRDEAEFALSAVHDLARRIPLNLDHVLLAGYSMGGSAVLDTACHAPQGFSAFVVLNGAMWNPLPDSCTKSVELLHIHAFSDEVMPLEGLNYGPVSTGDVFAGLRLLRDVSLNDHTPDGYEVTNQIRCRYWNDNAFRFCLYDGDHTWPDNWMISALDWFKERSERP